MMSIIAALAFLLLCATSAASYRASILREPKFCHDLDCPKFSGYEVRHYLPSKWVGTTVTSTSYTTATGEGFEKLFRYISGANKDGIKIPMAAPVASKIVPLSGEESNYTTLFFVPFDYQENTPIPTDPTLAIINLPALKVYVKSFGGFITDELLKKKLKKLKEDLGKDGLGYVSEYYFAAAYDSPFRIINRHNEVWLKAK